MSHTEWILCERSSRWASAVRLALATEGLTLRLRETRSLPDLSTSLAERHTNLAAIEVHRGNFADVLAWLPNARRRFAGVRYVALMDRSLSDSTGEICDALAEAGAEAISASPRQLSTILVLGRRHAATTTETDESVPLATRVWASLPWQAT